jgi:hypothetical protein
MGKIDPELIRVLQRLLSVGMFIYAAGWLKLSPEILAMVSYMLGGVGGQTFPGIGQVDVRALEKLNKALASKPPSNPPPHGDDEPTDPQRPSARR